LLKTSLGLSIARSYFTSIKIAPRCKHSSLLLTIL